MPVEGSVGTLKGPPLLSREAPKALLRDAVLGMRWLLDRARGIFSGAVPLASGAKGFGEGTQVPAVTSGPLVDDATRSPSPRPLS